MQVPALSQDVTEGAKLAIEIPDDLKDVFDISGNMEGVTPRLPQIKILHTAQMYELPGDIKAESFEGIILDQHPANAWWEKDISESGGNAIPDCFSMDGKMPDSNSGLRQAQDCTNCPQNQFGSDLKTGKGKACKNMKRLHILMEGSLLPRRLTVAPTSIKSFETFLTGLVDRGLPYKTVVANFSLEKKTSEGFVFSEIKISVERALKREELYLVAEFIRQYRDDARQQEIRADEYASESKPEPDQVKSDIPF